MARVPVIQIGPTAIVTLFEDLGDTDALSLQSDLNDVIEKGGIKGVILNISVLDMIDSFLGRLLHEITTGARLLGAETIVVGMQPSVAMTMVELGLRLDGIHTALDVPRGIALLNRVLVGQQ